jgi:hypothetical protein
MNPTSTELLATVFFGAAIIHTFCVKRFAHWAHQCPALAAGSLLMILLLTGKCLFAELVRRRLVGRLSGFLRAVLATATCHRFSIGGVLPETQNGKRC